jgi:hypothetical protein
MLNGREISNYEKGLLTGVAIGAVLGPSFTLIIFCLIICYDLGRPQLIDIGQRAFSKIIGINNDTGKQIVDSIDMETIQKLMKIAKTLQTQEDEEEEEVDDGGGGE